MKSSTTVSLMLLVLALTGFAQSAERAIEEAAERTIEKAAERAPDTTEAQKPTSPAPSSERDNADAEQAASSDTPEDFIPTEEISEDFAVAFPVDI